MPLINCRVTPFEETVLEVLLRELRRARKAKGQLSVTIDPYLDGSGVHIFACPNEMGRSYRFDAAHMRGSLKKPRAKRSR